jgi:RNA polymerase sigma factor (sigma-70 family)
MAATAQDVALVSGLLNADSAAEAAFSGRYRRRFVWLAQSAGVPLQECEDLAQEGLAAAFSQIQRGLFRGECSLGTWMETILRGKIVDYRRSSSKQLLGAGLDGERRESGSNLTSGMLVCRPNFELVLTVRAILNQMPLRHRVVLVFNKMCGFTIQEIAAKLCWPAGSVGRVLMEGKQMFCEMLSEEVKKSR